MANGQPWQDWVGRALACPIEWDFGTRVVFPDGTEWVCKDRGGAIRYTANGMTWVDQLTGSPLYYYGQFVEVRLYPPETEE